jgi:osmotically-inducible protein OsmY
VLPPARYATAESKVSDVTASGTSGSKQTEEDRRIGDELTGRLQEAKQSGQLHGFGISVHVENGYVWLKGRVGSAAQRQMALDLARRTSGVRQVVNELSVAEAAANIAQNLTGRLQSAEADGSLRGAKLNVKVDGPDVWLTGTVSKPQQEQLAVDLAREVPGVRRVISGLQVEGMTQPVLAMPIAPDLAAIGPPRRGLPTLATAAGNSSAARSASPTVAIAQPTATPSLPAMSATSAADVTFTVKPVATSEPAPAPYPSTQPIVTSLVDQTPRPLGIPQLASYAGAAAAAPLVAIAGAAGMAPAQLPGPGYAVVPARYDHPSLPGYAWPTYAAHPNYAAVTYPRQYSPSAWPYIGPFYPYPQVPLGWRKVTLKWDDGWWNLDFKAK